MINDRTIDVITADLNQACALTEKIIELVEKTELDNVEVLNNQRLALIELIFSSDKNKIDVELAKHLFALNAQATKALEHQALLNMQQQQKNRKGNVAHSAYMQHSP